MPSGIDKYKATVGYGARANMFAVTLTLPTKISSDTNYKDVSTTLELLCHEVNFPAQRTIETQKIHMYGEMFNLATKKGNYDDITIKWRSPEDLTIENSLEAWQHLIQKPGFTSDAKGTHDRTRAVPADYKGEILINVYDNDVTTVIRTVKCIGAFIEEVNSFELDVTKSERKEFTAKFAIDYYEIV